MAELRPGDIFAGYTIVRTLGEGGMGTVYLARHPRLPQQVALKLLTREMAVSDELRHRFLREADVVARLDHWLVSAAAPGSCLLLTRLGGNTADH
ncbi:hypothetical protein [Nocardia sp. alder85J]|uniref:hypothetical protein n=1 Tax=Nocardia sp. alder85J TaxID=2862949 RepID=UPI003A4DA0EC